MLHMSDSVHFLHKIFFANRVAEECLSKAGITVQRLEAKEAPDEAEELDPNSVFMTADFVVHLPSAVSIAGADVRKDGLHIGEPVLYDYWISAEADRAFEGRRRASEASKTLSRHTSRT